MSKNNYKTIMDLYKITENTSSIKVEKLNVKKETPPVVKQIKTHNKPNITPVKKDMTMKWEVSNGKGHLPEIWGPSFWFTLHNGANAYPENPPIITKERMKNFILGMPVMIPCFKCKDHATSFIESNIEKLDTIVSNRKNLFNFFVDFHNYVNKRYNKKIFTYDEAFNLYNGNIKVEKLKYS